MPFLDIRKTDIRPEHYARGQKFGFHCRSNDKTMEEAGLSTKHATVKHAQIVSLIERNHQKLKTILEVYVTGDQLQWDHYVNIAVMAHNTIYHGSLKCAPAEIFHGRTPHRALHLKFANPVRPDNSSTEILKMLDEVNEKNMENVQNKLRQKSQYPGSQNQRFGVLVEPKVWRLEFETTL